MTRCPSVIGVALLLAILLAAAAGCTVSRQRPPPPHHLHLVRPTATPEPRPRRPQPRSPRYAGAATALGLQRLWTGPPATSSAPSWPATWTATAAGGAGRLLRPQPVHVETRRAGALGL